MKGDLHVEQQSKTNLTERPLVLQRRPLPKPADSDNDEKIKSAHKSRKINKLITDDCGYEEYERCIVSPNCIKINGPNPFPSRKPKKLAGIKKTIPHIEQNCATIVSLPPWFYSDFEHSFYKTKGYVPTQGTHIEASNTTLPLLHAQNLNENNSIPQYLRKKPWRILLLEQQFKELNQLELNRSKTYPEPQKHFIVKVPHALENRNSICELDVNIDEGNEVLLPNISSFQIRKCIVKLTTEQLHFLSNLHDENNSMAIDETELEYIVNNENNIVISSDASKLKLKAFFLNTFPTIPQSSFATITWIDLSFNNFSNIPEELFFLSNIMSLNMRNNPLSVISKEIKKMKKLRYANFSFCLLSEVSRNLFSLDQLEVLDLSYNLITSIHSDIGKLLPLKELYLDGNRIQVFPMSILKLNLNSLYINANFTYKAFWRETCPANPQKLLDLALLASMQSCRVVPDDFKAKHLSASRCMYCDGAMVGEGVPVLKPVLEVFGVKNLPLLFYVCSQSCRVELQYSTEVSNALL